MKFKRIAKVIDSLEKCIYAYPVGSMSNLESVIQRSGKRIDAILHDKSPDHGKADYYPPRYDRKNRYKKEDIRQEDKPDYKDTLFDPDLKK